MIEEVLPWLERLEALLRATARRGGRCACGDKFAPKRPCDFCTLMREADDVATLAVRLERQSSARDAPRGQRAA